MRETSLRLINPLGLHARAAAQLVRLAAKFKSRIILHREDKNITANAKSILSVLSIAAAYGVELKITFDGEDEAEALTAVTELFENGFGELSEPPA